MKLATPVRELSEGSEEQTVWLPGERVGTEEKLWSCEVTLRN